MAHVAGFEVGRAPNAHLELVRALCLLRKLRRLRGQTGAQADQRRTEIWLHAWARRLCARRVFHGDVRRRWRTAAMLQSGQGRNGASLWAGSFVRWSGWITSTASSQHHFAFCFLRFRFVFFKWVLSGLIVPLHRPPMRSFLPTTHTHTHTQHSSHVPHAPCIEHTLSRAQLPLSPGLCLLQRVPASVLDHVDWCVQDGVS